MITLESLLAEDGVKVQGTGSKRLGLCPFHEDTNVSFSVNVEKGLYFCHGCGAKGDAVTYLVEKRGMGKREAIEQVKGSRGVFKPNPSSKPSSKPPYRFHNLPSRNSAGAARVAAHEYYDAEGALVFVVCRYAKISAAEEKKALENKKPHRKCDMWTPAPEGGWYAQGPQKMKYRTLYRLPELLAAPEKKQVMVVEGEKCADAVAKFFPKAVVTCWSGGVNNFHKTDLSPLHGRPLLLLADTDKVGREEMQKLSNALYGECPKIRLVLPEGDSKDDIADWLEKGGPAEARARISEMVQDATKPKKEKEKEKKPPVEVDTGEEQLYSNHYYKVMGNIGDSIAILLGTYRMLLFSRASMCSSATLISLASFPWWRTMLQSDSLGQVVCQQVGSSLIRQADKLGQIDHRMIVGRGLFRDPTGRLVWHLGNRLHFDGKDLELGNIPDFMPVSGPPVRIKGDPATEVDRKRAAAAILHCRWDKPSDGKKFLAWLVSCVIGGGLKWRPHAWLNGGADSGKTWLLDEVAKPICGDFYLPLGDYTVAGVANSVRSDSVGVFFDEAEPNRTHIEGILDVLRLASTGTAARVRSNRMNIGVDFYQPRFSGMLSSINIAEMGKANQSRFCMITLSQEKQPDWLKIEKSIHDSLGDPGKFLAAMVRDGPAIVRRTEEIRRTMIQEGQATRRASTDAVLTAGWEWWSGQGERVVSMEVQASDNMDDGERMLFDILGMRVRVPQNPDQTLARVLLNGDPEKIGQDHGLKVDDDEGVLHVHPEHPTLVEKLSRTPKWSHVDVKNTLLQIPGATMRAQPLYFGTLRRRSVKVPKAACDKLGLEIFTGSVEMQDDIPF